MLNFSLKLNDRMFDKDVEMQPIRKGFGEGLLIAGEHDKQVIGLCADLTDSTYMHLFKAKFPERFVEMGVAEQAMATVASGMAAMGKVPFITSYSMFSPGRNWEQIRTTICYNDRNVKIIGSHSGISVGPDGGTHQALEDIALTRVLPRLTVISPCDALEAKRATIAVAQAVGMAIADRMDNGRSSDKFIYCLMSDGEHDEGNTWEAILQGGKQKLHNLIAIVDRNNIQIDGFTEDVLPLEPFADKWRAFNWHVQEIDGHSFTEIIQAVARAKAVFDQPSVIIARTIPGKGVKEFERKFEWHGKPPNKEEAEMALKELRTLGGKIKSE